MYVTFHYISLLLDLAFIEKARKPGTDQGLEEAQTKSNKEESTSETIGEHNLNPKIYINHIHNSQLTLINIMNISKMNFHIKVALCSQNIEFLFFFGSHGQAI